VKLRAQLWYRTEWSESVEVDVPDGATRDEAAEARRSAADRHHPVGPPPSRATSADLLYVSWADDPQFSDDPPVTP